MMAMMFGFILVDGVIDVFMFGCLLVRKERGIRCLDERFECFFMNSPLYGTHKRNTFNKKEE